MEEFFQLHIECLGDGIERIYPSRNCAILNLAQVRSPNPCQIRQLGLGQSVLLPQFAQTTAKPDGERYCHAPMLVVNVEIIVRYAEQ